MTALLKNYKAALPYLLPLAALHAAPAKKEFYEPPKCIQELLEALTTDYLGSFPVEENKVLTQEEIEAQKAKASYDVELPHPSLRSLAECYLTIIAPENPFLDTLFQERSTGRWRTLLGPQVAQTADMVVGPASSPGAHMVSEIVPDQAPVLSRIGAVLLLQMPTCKAKLLGDMQQAVKHIVSRPALQRDLEAAYAQIKEVEGSALHLYEGLEDPLWGNAFQQELTTVFANKEGRFINSARIEAKKRWVYDINLLLINGSLGLLLSLPFFFLLYCFLRSLFIADSEVYGQTLAERLPAKWFVQAFRSAGVLAGLVAWIRPMPELEDFIEVANVFAFVKENQDQPAVAQALQKKFVTYFFTAVFAALYFFVLISLRVAWLIYQATVQHQLLTSYVAKRLEAFAQLVRSARQIDLLIQRDPVLAPLLGKHLQHTRALLAGRHPDPAVNRLAKTLATYSFRRWHLLLSSTGTLLTTMTALQEHLEAFKPMLMELAWVGNYLTAAQLAQRHSDQANAYTFTRFLAPSERAGLYIALQKGWNPALEPSKAVPNDFLIDAQQANTMVLTGPNACGKSAYGKMVLKNLLLMHTFTLAAASKAALTPLSLINSFKEPKDDIHRQLSLFAMEMRNVAWQHQALSVLSQGQHAFTLYDEFLSSTNPVESSALNYACIEELIDKYPNHANVVVTHNALLAGLAKVNPRVRSFQAVIERHADGSYTRTFLIRPGSSHERVGIDLAARELKNPSLIEEARQVAQEMAQKKKQIADEILDRRKAQQAQRG